MEDRVIRQMCADKIMGYPPEITLIGDLFNPLEDDKDSCAVLDRMIAEGWECKMECSAYVTPYTNNLWWMCRFRLGEGFSDTLDDIGCRRLIKNGRTWKGHGSYSRRRAITIGALVARGLCKPDSVYDY